MINALLFKVMTIKPEVSATGVVYAPSVLINWVNPSITVFPLINPQGCNHLDNYLSTDQSSGL